MQNSELFAASWLGCEPVLLQDGTDDFLLSPTLDQIVTFLLCTWWDVNLWLFFSCLDDTWWLLHGIQKTKQTTDLAESVLDGELVTFCFVRCGMKTIDLPVVSEQTHGADDLTVSEQVKQSNDKLVLLQLIQTTFMLCNPWDMNPRPSYCITIRALTNLLLYWRQKHHFWWYRPWSSVQARMFLLCLTRDTN